MVRTLVLAALVVVAACASQPAPLEPAAPQTAGDIRSAEILKRHPPPGRLVDIGGRKLHVLCEGPQRGPTVIIETGAIASSVFYWQVQDEIATIARVCTYDRAGLGWSDPAPLPRTLKQRADDLNLLLTKGRIRGPYILVGHSMGGLLVRMYAKDHPENVAGMVLMEASEEQVNATPRAIEGNRATAAQLGFAINILAGGGEVPQLRPPTGPLEMEIAMRESVVRAGQDELLALARTDEEVRELGGLGELGDIPLVVVTRGRQDRSWMPERVAEWDSAHARLAALSTRSVRLVAQNSGHSVHYDEPAMFAEAVKRVLELGNERR